MNQLPVLTCEDGSILISVPSANAKEFRELVQRGSNLNPDASAWMKEFADLVTSGEVKQDYYAQSNTPRPV